MWQSRVCARNPYPGEGLLLALAAAGWWLTAAFGHFVLLSVMELLFVYSIAEVRRPQVWGGRQVCSPRPQRLECPTQSRAAGSHDDYDYRIIH